MTLAAGKTMESGGRRCLRVEHQRSTGTQGGLQKKKEKQEKVTVFPRLSPPLQYLHLSINPLSAIWRIYPSSKWSSQWPYDGYIRHGWKTSCGRGRGSATPECFGRGSQRTIFVRSLKLSLFFPELCSFRRVFCFPRFCIIWRQPFEPWGFRFRRCLGALFWKLRSVTWHFLANSDYDHEYLLKISFLFSKQSRCYLSDSYGDPQAEQSSFVVVRRKLEWKRDFQALARSSAEGPSIVVAFSTSRLRWSMVQKRQKPDEVSLRLPFIVHKTSEETSEFWGACFRDPWCFYRFAIRCFPVCGWTVARWSGCRSGTAKKSSHPWHFRCWSSSRNGNNLECTNLVHWTEALHRFSSRDAIIAVGSALEKHFDGDFTQDQEKEITVKRWPPGYQSWKLCLAPNGLAPSGLSVPTSKKYLPPLAPRGVHRRYTLKAALFDLKNLVLQQFDLNFIVSEMKRRRWKNNSPPE